MIDSFTKIFSGLLRRRPDYEGIGQDSALELVAIHIPKTAGRSFNMILRKVYGDDKVLHISRKHIRNEAAILRKITRENIRVLHGHFTYAEISRLLGENDFPILTWLRDPVERVISNYYFFIRRIRRQFRLHTYRRRNETLLEYASREDTRNRMAEYLNGIDLQDLFFVGISEYFTDDLRSLSQRLGWGGVSPVQLNVNKAYKALFGSIPQETMTKIARLNERDVALYEKALSMRGFSRNDLPSGRKYG